MKNQKLAAELLKSVINELPRHLLDVRFNVSDDVAHKTEVLCSKLDDDECYSTSIFGLINSVCGGYLAVNPSNGEIFVMSDEQHSKVFATQVQADLEKPYAITEIKEMKDACFDMVEKIKAIELALMEHNKSKPGASYGSFP